MKMILGTAQLRRSYGAVQRRDQPLDRRGATHLLRHAQERGIDALDTAPTYGDAESAIGVAGVTMPVHTKLDARLAPTKSVQRSLAALGRARIDLLYVHDPTEVLNPRSKVLAEAQEMVGSVVDRLGASVYETTEFEAAVRDPRIDVVQVPLNLLDRRFTGPMLQMAHDCGCEVLARSVLLQGLLADPHHAFRSVAALQRALADFGRIVDAASASAFELAIGWVANQGVDGVIVGADRARDLDQVLNALRAPVVTLNELAALDRMRTPGWPATDPRAWV